MAKKVLNGHPLAPINMDSEARGTWKIVRDTDGVVREFLAGVTEQEAWNEAYWYFRTSVFWDVPALHSAVRVV